ncbi:MAG: C69 family dipeptidase [Atribacterota bacterium]|nr:C69 family dipeptidase [Atribacterota bacterium]
MCDTIVTLDSASEGGMTLFGKNSDREPDEVQNICIIPRREHNSNDTVDCTYLTIPQVSETARVFLCKPFWMFGAEMAANEHGVIIGNEAIFTREKPDNNGLTGMDLVRLAAERSSTARQALEIIIRLLEQYGQGGNCGYRFKLKYMNSFLIADKKEAYVLETVKRWWAWKKITDIWSISNVISLQQDYDECSEGLIKNAVDKGYCKSSDNFNFRKCYSDKLMTWAANGGVREKCSRKLLEGKNKRFTMKDFIDILRNHGDGSQWTPNKGPGGTICLHAADPLFRRTQTVCSLIAGIGEENMVFYTTGASNPCMSPYFPVFSCNTELPSEYKEGSKYYDKDSYWWESEYYHRKALSYYDSALAVIRPLINNYEKEMLSKTEGSGINVNQNTVDNYFLKARDIVRDWGNRLDKFSSVKTSFYYRHYWNHYNKINGIIF